MMMIFSEVASTWANLTTCLVSESYPSPDYWLIIFGSMA